MNSAISLQLNLCYSGHFSPKRRILRSSLPAIFSVLGTSRPGKALQTGDDVLQTFIKERELNGDFIAKLSDRIWLREATNSHNTSVAVKVPENSTQSPEQASGEASDGGGFLKLKRTNEWVLGDSALAPANKKMSMKELQNHSERRRKLNLLKYEALKRELFLLTVGIGAACSGYCLAVLSVEVTCYIPDIFMFLIC
ncbi:hypothetical protein M9H77_16626 [Catharanthus roseus]|uniref:Uncharacterized protein n=1 Tax=Catharanthus roseus TaxID=4058 RepID=A0ACC0B2P0_CATRO|nr:hypothetical protein M9H77_16626 [Catharanthus roseus]